MFIGIQKKQEVIQQNSATWRFERMMDCGEFIQYSKWIFERVDDLVKKAPNKLFQTVCKTTSSQLEPCELCHDEEAKL